MVILETEGLGVYAQSVFEQCANDQYVITFVSWIHHHCIKCFH